MMRSDSDEGETHISGDMRVARRLLERFRSAGYDDAELESFLNDPYGMMALNELLRRQALPPWGEPFALIVGLSWRTVDERQRVQVRSILSGVQVRQRRFHRGVPQDHDKDTCPECWYTPREFGASNHWRVVSDSCMIRVISGDSGRRRIEVRQRCTDKCTSLKEQWTETWTVGHCNEQHDWVLVTEDIQLYASSTFPRGILVRRALRLEPTYTWSTPRFIPQSPDSWVNLTEDGAVQARFWVSINRSSPAKIALRRRLDYVPRLSCEPFWTEVRQAQDEYEGDGYCLRVSWRHPEANPRTPHGLAVEHGDEEYIIPLHNLAVLVTPTLKAHVGITGHLRVWRGSYEPKMDVQQWSAPAEVVLDQPHTLNEQLRLVPHRFPHRGVRLQNRSTGPVPGFRWQTIWDIRPGTTQELEGFRITVLDTEYRVQIQQLL